MYSRLPIKGSELEAKVQVRLKLEGGLIEGFYSASSTQTDPLMSLYLSLCIRVSLMSECDTVLMTAIVILQQVSNIVTLNVES